MTRVMVIIESGVEEERAPSPPRCARAAVDLALKRYGKSVRVYTIGAHDVLLRYALAAGASSATPLPSLTGLEFDVALLGGRFEPWGELFPATFAEEKQCAMVLDVLDVEPTEKGVRVVRDIGKGAREILSVEGPSVLCVSEAAERLAYVSRYRRKKIDLTGCSSLAPTLDVPVDCAKGPWEQIVPRVKRGGPDTKSGETATDRALEVLGASDGSNADSPGQPLSDADTLTCAQHLLRYLSHHGLIGKLHGDFSGDRPNTPRLPLSSPRERREKQVSLAVSARVGRGPRPIDGDVRRIEGRPIPRITSDRSDAPTVGKLSRAPRPVGVRLSCRIRGPFPPTSQQP